MAKPKPMDIFGAAWSDHPARIERAWRAAVAAHDWVLVSGDLSWAMTLEEALPDLAFLHSLPGRKVLGKGNHCHWWTSRAKVEAVLPPSIVLLQNDAVALGGGPVVAGTRGWDLPGAPHAPEGSERLLAREAERLKLSLAAAARLEPKPLLVMTHYPPIDPRGAQGPLAALIEAAGAEVCIYGHLHGPDHRSGFQGVRGGVRYLLTSADALGFAPLLLLDTAEGPGARLETGDDA